MLLKNADKSRIDGCYVDNLTTPTSPFYLLVEAQQSYNRKEYGKALSSADILIDRYRDKALEMQNTLVEFPWESKDKIFSYRELNAVGTALVMNLQEQKNQFGYAQCWDPRGQGFVKLNQISEELLKFKKIKPQ